MPQAYLWCRLIACCNIKGESSDLLDHKNGDVTDLCCAKELTRLLENSNKVTQKKGKLILLKRAVWLLVETRLTQANCNYGILKDLK